MNFNRTNIGSAFTWDQTDGRSDERGVLKRRPLMSETNENKTPSSPSNGGKKSTSVRSGRPGILVKLTGRETDAEIRKLAEEFVKAVKGGQ